MADTMSLKYRLARAPERFWQKRGFRAFALGFLTAFLFFIPFILFDNGYFLFYGDFNVQQVPFYQMVHDAIRSGNFLWNWNTDLGANLIGSYTFYNLGSPFFWLTLLFPSGAVPYLMGPLLMLKFACASLTGYIYLKRYVKNPDFAVIGGMLYAFSGFSVYNIFFNHFHEAIVIFPLLLAALDAYMVEKRRGVFALTVFAACLMNYYFFAGQVVFCLIYWFVRMLSRSWKMTLREFLWLLFESVIGVAMTAVLLLPTVLAVLQNSRVDSPTYGWGALLYGQEQRYLHILESFFFPPDIPARPNFTPDSDAKWASLGAWLPLFSMAGVFAFLQTKRKNWIKRIVVLLLFMTMVPILNNAFQLFNAAYYARWFYMITLMCSLATVCALETAEVDWNRAFRWAGGITAAIALAVGLMPRSIDSDGNFTDFGLEDYPHRFWPYVAIAMVSLLLCYLLIPMLRRSPRRFARYATLGVMLVSVIYAAYFIALGKTQSYDTHNYVIPYCLNGGRDLNLPDENPDEDYRVDFYNAMDNVGMFWQMPTIQAFHSIVPGSVMDFYNSIDNGRGVGSRPNADHYGIRGLLSVKYLFDFANDNDSFYETAFQNTKMPGFSKYDTQNGFDVYQNDYYIPYGFTYDQYVTTRKYEGVAKSYREFVLLDALVLSDAQIQKYGHLLTPMDSVDMVRYTQDYYLEMCEARRRETCYFFEARGDGFTAKIDLSKENLVFFSVPWEEGWSATVDGQPADIERVNVAFMAVDVPAGDHIIEFHYVTPGLKLGAAATGACVLLFAAYLVFLPKWEKKRKARCRLTAEEPEALEEYDLSNPEEEIPDETADTAPQEEKEMPEEETKPGSPAEKQED